MNPMMRPANSPACWGMQYSDGDPECAQCPFRDGCRPVSINRAISQQPIPVQMPVQIRPQQAPMVPLPAKPYLPTMTQQQPMFRTPIPAPAPVQQQVAAYQNPPPVQYQPQQYSQAAIPDPNNPHPMVPMMRPGAAGPPYFFCQYPGEATVERLGKNMALRGAEAIFGELMFFFRHWTWPPRS